MRGLLVDELHTRSSLDYRVVEYSSYEVGTGEVERESWERGKVDESAPRRGYYGVEYIHMHRRGGYR